MKFIPIIACLLAFSVAFAQNKVTLENLRELPNVGSPMLSPDEKFVLYTVSTQDFENNTTRSKLMIINTESNDKTELTKDVSDPKWSPDGKYISFRGTFGGKSGIYRATFKGGRKPSIDIPVLVAEVHSSNHFTGHSTRKNYEWSPDGRYIAFVSADPTSCNKRTDPNDPLVVERTMYKGRTAFSDNCLTRIYIVENNGNNLKTITPGNYDSHSLSWTSDGNNVVFLSNRTDNPDHNYNNDLWKVNIQTGNITQLSNTVGTEHEPAASPKSSQIAFSATKRPINTKDSPPEDTHIYLVNDNGQNRTDLSAVLDQRATNPQWDANGEWVYFTIRDKGKTSIYRAKSGQKPQAIIDERGSAGSFQVGKDKIVYTFSMPNQPTEIYIANLDGVGKKRLTFETFNWTQGKELAKVEDFWVESFDGTPVQGFIAYPTNISPGAKLPVIHSIHGGPHGMYGFSFSTTNELLVANGYAVVFINPRGSTGYGQKFSDGTYQAWGGGDYRDLMAGMDAALAKYNFLDSTRMGVTGGSYGGFMTNWVVTQTNRYKAAATVASVSNLISFYGNSLYQDLIETEFNGMPWDNYSLLWNFSPMAHIKNVKTPTLLLHGENDYDVPITQAEEFYIGLKKLGVPARFVRYPNEGHGFSQPKHQAHYLQELVGWFDKHVKLAKP
ncbi:MAG: prolyl oligopeptidase family serine peptidase [Saprospiraceae bacterium]